MLNWPVNWIFVCLEIIYKKWKHGYMKDNINIGFHFRTGGNYQYFTFVSYNNWDILREVKYQIYFEMLCHQDTEMCLHRLGIVIL